MSAILNIRDDYDDVFYTTLVFESAEERAKAIAVFDEVKEREDGWCTGDMYDALYDAGIDYEDYFDDRDMETYYW